VDDPLPTEREVAGCALGVQPLVRPIAEEAEAAQRALLGEARAAAANLPAGPSRQLSENSIADYEQEIDRQSQMYAAFVHDACSADPHLTPTCTQTVLDTVGETVRDANRDLPLQADMFGGFETGIPDVDASQDLLIIEYELGGRLQWDAVLADGFAACALRAMGEPVPEPLPLPTLTPPSVG